MLRLLTAILLLATHLASGQLIQVPIPHGSASATVNTRAGRTKATLDLPFWDDFATEAADSPSAGKWFAGTSVWINDGLAINPPSLRVATFDGIDSLGNPYSVNDLLAKGFADKLESHPIDLTAVTQGERSSVYLSFHYEMKGLGEMPDAGDKLILEFRTSENKWEQVWAAENDGTLLPDAFTHVTVPVTDDKYFHAGFRFRFKNFARLSGPYDMWHVDYIYLNKGRSASDTSFPDRSIVAPLGSIFHSYRSLPKDHFFVDKDAVLAKPTMVVHNLRLNNNQPLNYFSYAEIEEFKDAIADQKPAVLMDSATTIGSVNSLEYKTAEVNTQNLSDLLDESADSLHIKLKVGLSTKDNLTPDQDGDYDPKFAPIDFRVNDTTSTGFWLSSYYAYDDGSAEYGAALNQPGAQIAYEFNIIGAESGFVTAVQLYFPHFGYGTSQSIELMIWNDLLDEDKSILYREVVTIQRTGENKFWIKKLNRPVKVARRFYVGWKQSTAAVIAVGLDKNNNSGDKMHFNISGTWEVNTQLSGSLMIRPVFGEGTEEEPDPDPVSGIEDELTEAGGAVYPNPSEGTFTIPGSVQQVHLFDISGRPVAFTTAETPDQTRVTINNPGQGLFILRYLRNGRPMVQKVMVH